MAIQHKYAINRQLSSWKKSGFWAKSRKWRNRTLRVERLESRQLLSATVQSALAAAAPLDSGVLEDSHQYALWAKAQPDEWFTGVGQPIVSYSKPAPTPNAMPRTNYGYVWGMTQTKTSVWFSAAANVGTAFGIAAQTDGAFATSYQVAEGAKSKYSGVPALLKNFVGDWRPPKVYQYDMATGKTVDRTPQDSIIKNTLGFRSAGANDQVVLMAGPNLSMTGMNVIAFDATSGKYLGSTTIRQYADIRQWVTYKGQLYAGVSRTFSTRLEGAVIRWTGTKARPLQFTEVGKLDAEGANICVHNGRLYVSTWGAFEGSLMYQLGYRTNKPCGIWMSPLLEQPGKSGLTSKDAGNWKKVWNITEYEPDRVIAKTYGGGALYSFDGYLYWGTLNPPTSPNLFLESYPNSGVDFKDFLSPVRREAVLFRAKNLGGVDKNSQGQVVPRKIDLLYGDPTLPVYNGTTKTWTPTANKMNASPLFGYAGYRETPADATSPKTCFYTYTMAVYHGHLYVGTEDFFGNFLGDLYVAAGGDLAAMDAIAATPPPGGPGFTQISIGADLWMISPDDAQGNPVDPVCIDEHGIGNPWNMGIRTMIANDSGLFLGTSSSSNLTTVPYNPPVNSLKPGGWELIQVTDGSLGATSTLVVPAVAASSPKSAGSSAASISAAVTMAANAKSAAALTQAVDAVLGQMGAGSGTSPDKSNPLHRGGRLTARRI